MTSLAKAVPSLAGVLLGAVLYAGYVPWIVPAGMGGSALLLLWVGRQQAGVAPSRANTLISCWILAGIAVMSGVTALLIFTALQAASWFPGLGTEEGKQVSSAVAGALTTFFGVLVSKDMEDGQGVFWPGTQFRKALEKAYGTGPLAPRGDSVHWDAVYAHRIQSSNTEGWGFKARSRRAEILEHHLRDLNSAPSQ